MTDLSQTLEELDRTNKEAFAALADLEACGPKLAPGPLLGIKDWLQEQRILITQAKKALQERGK